MRRVLIIDDHPGVGQALELLLSLHDIEASVATSPQAGLALLDKRTYGLVIQDMNFTADTTSGEEGEQLFRAIRARRPRPARHPADGLDTVGHCRRPRQGRRRRLPGQALGRRQANRHRREPAGTRRGEPRDRPAARSARRPPRRAVAAS